MTKPHDTEDPTRSSAADAAGMAADYSARHTYARGYDDGRKAEQARADAAEQRAEALLTALREISPLAQGAVDDFAQRCSDRVNDAIRARDEVGIQLAAAQAEIFRRGAVLVVMRGALADIADSEDEHGIPSTREWMEHRAQSALDEVRALDAVSGDALAKGVSDNVTCVVCGRVDIEAFQCWRVGHLSPPPSPAGASAQPSGSTPAASSATSSSSEAAGSRSAQSGIRDEPSNVKGGE